MEIEYIPERPISIYALICPITNEVRYVGASYDAERRFKSHLVNKWPNKKMKVWMDELQEKGLKPNYEVLEVLQTRVEAVDREQFYIEKYRNTIVNGDSRLTLPLESISSSKDDKYKVSFYLTKERLEKIIDVLRDETFSLDYSFYTIISNHKPTHNYRNEDKIKWIKTDDERKIKLEPKVKIK